MKCDECDGRGRIDGESHEPFTHCIKCKGTGESEGIPLPDYTIPHFSEIEYKPTKPELTYKQVHETMESLTIALQNLTTAIYRHHPKMETPAQVDLYDAYHKALELLKTTD